MTETVWSAKCAPHWQQKWRTRKANTLDIEGGAKPGSTVQYLVNSKYAVAVRVIKIDGHRWAVDAIDASGAVVAALALRAPQRRRLDTVKLENLTAHILELLRLTPVT